MVFGFNEFLATVVIILLAVALFGFLHYAARKFLKLGFMLRFKSVVVVGIWPYRQDIARLDGEYLNWVIYEGDFSDQVKQVVREAVKP